MRGLLFLTRGLDLRLGLLPQSAQAREVQPIGLPPRITARRGSAESLFAANVQEPLASTSPAPPLRVSTLREAQIYVQRFSCWLAYLSSLSRSIPLMPSSVQSFARSSSRFHH